MPAGWSRTLTALAALLAACAPSPVAATQIDVPGFLVIEEWEIPNPPVDPNRCITTFFVQFADVLGAGAYSVVIFNHILGQNQTFTTGPEFFPDDEYTVSNGPQQSITYTAPAGTHRVAVGQNSSGSGCQSAPRFDVVSITTDVVGDGRLTASIAADPEELFVDDDFTATMTVGAEDGTITGVVPGALVLGGAGRARVLAGPTPTQIATLAPGASATFVWRLVAEATGVVSVRGTVSGTTQSGGTATAEARCSVGAARAGAAAAQASVCSIDGGAAVEVKPCKIEMPDLSAPLLAFRIDSHGDSVPPPGAGYPPGGT
jgi:hypothetical protein